jgi:hypothetical protein
MPDVAEVLTDRSAHAGEHMMRRLTLALLIAVAFVYGGSGIYETVHWRSMSDQFTAWGYPAYWSLVTSLTKTIAAALALLPRTRLIGLAICSIVGVAAVATVLWTQSSQLYVPASLVTCLTVIATYLAIRGQKASK